MPQYKNPSFQKTYDAMIAAALDPSSELYYNGKPHRGAMHRCAFWDGYAGVERTANVIPGTISAVCFAAGKAFAKTHPGIAAGEASWTPRVTGQGDAVVRPQPQPTPKLPTVASGEWLATATMANIPGGNIAWHGMQGRLYSAMIGRRCIGTVRFNPMCRVWQAKLEGWIWKVEPDEPAARLGTSTAPVKNFARHTQAQRAIEAAWKIPRHVA